MTQAHLNKIEQIMDRASSGEYGEDSEAIGKMAGVLMAAKFDHGWGPFICGTSGPKGADGLCDGYHICPSYGADFRATTVYYRKAAE